MMGLGLDSRVSLRVGVVAVALGMCSSFVACSSDDGENDTTSSSSAGGSGATGGAGSVGGAGGTGGEAGVGGMGGMGCIDHENDGDEITGEYVDTAMPEAAGGPISAGTYHLVELRIYTGPGGMTGAATTKWKETAVWTSTELRTALDAFNGEGELHLGMAYDLGDGSGSLNLSVICPEPLSVPWDGYTADHDNLTLFASGIATNGASFHYERLPDPMD
jgi:hypothetical protein